MPRNRKYQPTTNSTADLVIGLMKVSLGSADVDASTVAEHAAGTPATPLATVGALKSASLAMTPTFKEHKAGYPQVLDFKIAELLSAVYKFEAEEITSAVNLALLDDAISSLETGTPYFRAIEARAEFARGNTLSLFSNYAQLKPNLNLNFGDDFSAAPFEFEALSNPQFANYRDLVYRLRTSATPTARSRDNQPMTGSPNNLAIGMFQVRVGRPTSAASGRTSKVWPAKLVKLGGSVAGTRPTVTSGGTYDGTAGPYGCFIVEVTAIAGDSVVVKYWAPDAPQSGAPSGTGIAITGATALEAGVTISFSNELSANNAVGDTYVIGVQAGGAAAGGVTGIISEHSFLTSADSVGAIQSASIATNPVYKDHFSGYPKIKDLSILESSTVTIDTALEEINPALNNAILNVGEAASVYDMIFDASRSGTLYNVPVEIVANMATGDVLSFWFPNCQIIPTGEFSPSNEWATMPFQLDAQVQNGMYRIYRQKFNIPAI